MTKTRLFLRFFPFSGRLWRRPGSARPIQGAAPSVLVVFLALIIISIGDGYTTFVHAQSQTPQNNPTLFSVIRDMFKRNDQNAPQHAQPNTTREPATQRTRPQRQRARTSQENQRQASGAKRKPAILPKTADALVVGVYGDFLAASLERGLMDAFSTTPNVRTLARVKGSSGFVREDHYNWIETIDGLIAQDKPDFVVIMLGTNDRQAILQPTNLPYRSQEWVSAYQSRVGTFMKKLTAHKKPVFWVSLPSMRRASLNRAMTYFNTVHRDSAAGTDIKYIDTWNAFVDEEQRYTAFGPGLDGKVRRLRSGAGLNFSAAGRRKLAHFVEREIRRHLVNYDGELQAKATSIEAVPKAADLIIDGPRTQDERLNRVGPVLSLNVPWVGEGERLANVPILARTMARRPQEQERGRIANSLLSQDEQEKDPYRQLVIHGNRLSSTKGRADNFSWPREPDDGALDSIATFDADENPG